MTDTYKQLLDEEKKFPFGPKDIVAFVVVMKDDTIIRYQLEDDSIHTSTTTYNTSKKSDPYANYYSLSGVCNHTPKDPIFETPDGMVQLYIADAPGTRLKWKEFGLVLDCGGAIWGGYTDTPVVLQGDPELARKMNRYVLIPAKLDADKDVTTRVLRIHWTDRAAAPVHPQFWINLAERLKAEAIKEPIRVLCSCQGGHGRSGTSLVSLMMALNPLYTPLDAITHLRALHCPRAIESVTQHQYLNWVGQEMGRVEDALEAENVTSFRERFLKMPNAVAAYKSRLITPEEEKEKDRRGDAMCGM